MLLIGMAVSAVWMAALLPAWRQQVMREREAELVFRCEQYGRAIALFRAQNQRNPTTIDELLSRHHLRKKYLDPITGQEFLYLGAGIQSSGGPLASNPIPVGGQRPSGTPIQPPPSNEPGVYGVQSRSNATSIKIYQGQQQHSLWPCTYVQANQRGVGRQTGPGGGRPGGPAGDGRGRGVPGRGGPGDAGRGRGIGQGPGRGGGEVPPIGVGRPGGGGPGRGAGS